MKKIIVLCLCISIPFCYAEEIQSNECECLSIVEFSVKSPYLIKYSDIVNNEILKHGFDLILADYTSENQLILKEDLILTVLQLPASHRYVFKEEFEYVVNILIQEKAKLEKNATDSNKNQIEIIEMFINELKSHL